jgi:hypothetical protein
LPVLVDVAAATTDVVANVLEPPGIAISIGGSDAADGVTIVDGVVAAGLAAVLRVVGGFWCARLPGGVLFFFLSPIRRIGPVVGAKVRFNDISSSIAIPTNQCKMCG